jgi:polyhydroxyalkanoate synthesis regulator phasin
MGTEKIVKRMLDAGVQFTEMSQSSAEKLVHEFVKSGKLRKKDAEQAVQDLVDHGRSATEQLIAAVQSEVAKQLARFADRVDDLEARIEDLAHNVGVAKKAPSAPVAADPKPAAAPKNAAPKKAAPKKAAPKKAAPKKAAAKKAAAKKPAAKKPATTTAAGSSGVAKVVATRSANR